MIPANEQERLEDLYSYDILDTGPERDFDELAELANLVCGTQMSLVSLIDEHRQWNKASVGYPVPETPRELTICQHVILGSELFVVENALEDQRFRDLPGVQHDPRVRFYAGAPIISAKGFSLGTVCVFSDVPGQLTEVQRSTLLRLARQASLLLELRKKNEQLKRIAREQLQLKQLAELSGKMQKQFLSTMSHEIRTPLNGVIGMAHLLLSDNPAPHQLENLRSLKFASEHLLAVVNDVLDYNKITGSGLTFEQIDFNLLQLVREVGRAHAVAAQQKGIGLEFHIDAAVPEWVSGDPARLTQVLHNLLGNAVKFTEKGGVELQVRLEETGAGHFAIRFAVQDTGIGIAAEALEKVFDEFSQAHAGISRQFGGTGLGLAISKKLLELQGSEIFVQSKPGEGSTFSFTLALRKPAQVKAAASCPPEDKADFSELNILVAEDNPLNWVVLRKYLQLWGVEADHAGNGAVALEKAAGKRYDLVFMDLQMPVLDGYAATRRLREELHFEGPIFAITANAFVNEEQDLEALGFTGSVVKPFDRPELCARMTEVLQAKKSL
ncbi:GAF domain-containing hybrid sensor histidine kinase/response regulator [Flaviaesturariibacter aridisoli]|uniref:histidine kinase n=1 Tax=Flaviaesturariibacter aridisoli TaxID=2545761 RepID=A0A4R4DXK3_9BACT|nr:GAF domain-containing hybrid sensor histidine kinase/response regulator [Flaviaesturariibacter aridisoli]TCZ65758.1 hybrid sensor histidine kinase/response regulator [Flaviaesturariibacter aridisoli]